MSQIRPTWIALHRDISDSVPIRGQRRVDAALVLEAATGMIVQNTVATSKAAAVSRALKDALIRPADAVVKSVPARIVCPPELIEDVRSAALKLTRLSDTELVEGVDMLDAEEIFDAMVGHLEGRAQPEDAPSVSDWRLLYDVMAAYEATAPWQRWCDEDYFPIRVQIEDEILEGTGIVLGAAGVQRGFNLTADADSLVRAAEAAGEDGDPLASLEGALVLHLEPRREVFGVYAEKARRYGWPAESRNVPQLLTVHGGEAADPDRTDVRHLALALDAVLAQDAKQLVATDAEVSMSGELTFSDGVVGRFTIGRPSR